MKKVIFLSSVCGVGKSTTCDYIRDNNLLKDYSIFDVDNLLNVHDYDQSNLFYEDAIKVASLKSGDKNIIIGSCVNPVEIEQINIPSDIESKKMILLYCSTEELERRLKARNESRNCGSDEFIKGQVEYQNYMLAHSNLFQLIIDNTNFSIEEVANQIAEFIKENDKVNKI